MSYQGRENPEGNRLCWAFGGRGMKLGLLRHWQSRGFIEVSRPLLPTLASSSISPNAPHAAARLAAPYTVLQRLFVNL